MIKSSRIDHMAPVPSKEAIRALIEAADEDFKPHLIVSALGGLRASELRGLRWQDVDFEAGFIRIRQRADAYNEIGEPKSKAGFRDIPAGPMVLNALRHGPCGMCDMLDPASTVFPGTKVSALCRCRRRSYRRFIPSRARDGVVQRRAMAASPRRAVVSARSRAASGARPTVTTLHTNGHVPTTSMMSFSMMLSVEAFRFCSFFPDQDCSIRRCVVFETAPSEHFRSSQSARGSKRTGPIANGLTFEFPKRVQPNAFSRVPYCPMCFVTLERTFSRTCFAF